MLSVAEARARICAAFRPLGTEVVALSEALGRVLVEDVVARRTQPPLDVSAMDGYAVRAADVASVPARLRVVGCVPAGGYHGEPIGPGEAVRIFTGAPLPPGADAIVIQEDTETEGDTVVVREGAPTGRYVRPAGLDFRAGAVGLRAGRLLTARDIGMAAAMNVPWLRVRRRPRVAILSSGDELVMPGEPMAPHQIVSSNGLALAAFVTASGGTPVNLGIAPDDTTVLISRVKEAAGADLLLTSGGASVGEHDLMQEALATAGMTLDFWKIAMRPGKPLMFGRLGDTPALGLPGNPVSSLVCSIVYVAPAMRVMLGLPDIDESEEAVLGCDLPANDRRQDYLRARLSRDAQGRTVATPFTRQDSSMQALLAEADALLVRRPEAPPARAGDRVTILPLRGGWLQV